MKWYWHCINAVLSLTSLFLILYTSAVCRSTNSKRFGHLVLPRYPRTVYELLEVDQ